ncbi:MAG: GNAT family N-acetyltransferase [Proteobacteria bacterium]|nr:GNAT family N-acetyltransferase [Pseudomonadota bacterium]
MISQGEEPLAAEALAAAFRDTPLTRAVVRSQRPGRRLRSTRQGMRLTLASARRDGLRYRARPPGGPVLGALVGAPSEALPLPAPAASLQLRAWFGQGLRVVLRWAEVARALERVHPSEPHHYLALLGVDPAEQGRGTGTALLARFLAAVDAAGRPSYLETDRPENLAFYGRHGFEVQREIRLVGLPVWCLWRPARPASTEETR